VEGYMKTDDRMRLAKERREERDKGLVAREQLIMEKERRARLQYERTVEERWRRLDEQRQKEELRRAAVEEKRRQQLEEDRERLEALMKRSLERSLQLEQRTKRWSRGCTPGAGDSENAPLPFSAASAFPHGIASPLPAVSESGKSAAGVTTARFCPPQPCFPPLHVCLRKQYESISKFPRSQIADYAPDGDRWMTRGGKKSPSGATKTRSVASVGSNPILGNQCLQKERLCRERRTASPGCGSPLRRSESPASVTRHLASPTTSKLATETRSNSPSNANRYHHSPTRPRPNPPPDDRKPVDKTPERHGEQPKAARKNTDVNGSNASSHDLRNGVGAEIPKSRPSQESAACASAGRVAAGTINAEEATKLLAERRRQARAQKELEDRKRELEEDERFKSSERFFRHREEQRQKKLAQERQQQEAEALKLKERGKREEDLNRVKQEEDNRKKEDQEKQLQSQMDKEKETAQVQAQGDAERQRQGRDLQAQQEEEERQLRKKRIEEIMKRTRKGEADLKVLRPDSRQTGEELNGEAKARACLLQQQERAMEMNVNTQHRAHDRAADQTNKKPTAGEKVHQREGGVMNGAVEGEGSALKRSHPTAEVQSMEVSPASKEELVSIQEFSPVNEIQNSSVSNARALEDLIDLTGRVSYPKMSSDGHVGDCNKNLIEGVVSPMADSKLVGRS
uniref:MAP7 domain containing 2b n=1 Tax=Gasterosteus aculeatus TaxID=69293 RepID=G3QBS7_GASAC